MSKKPISKKSKDPAIERLELLAQLMDDRQLGELEIEEKGRRVKLVKRGHGGNPATALLGSEGTSSLVASASASPKVAAPSPTSPQKFSVSSEALGSNQRKIVSPFVGTFYRAPSPGASVYVQEGAPVRKGQVLCIVEAMKLMNEIESEFTGRLVRVLVENGDPVEFGQPLMVVEV
jgi:oxaloacetate decarboxylase alpha subunit